MKIRLITAICAIALLPTFVQAADLKAAAACDSDAAAAKAPTLTIIPRGVARGLDIKALAVPTSEPMAISVGTYFECWVDDNGLEHCINHLVFCTDDGSCVQVY